MQRPGFCNLLAFGSILCVLGIIAGIAWALLGCSQWERNQQFAIIQILTGAGCAFQSLVTLGVLRSQLWIVDQLIAQRQDPNQAENIPASSIEFDERDGIRNKPVLKRRKF